MPIDSSSCKLPPRNSKGKTMSQTTIFVCLLFCFVIGTTSGVVFNWGACPEVSTEKRFEYERYVGLWYEIARYPSAFEFNTKCVTSNHTMLDNGSVEIAMHRFYPIRGYVDYIMYAIQDQTNPAIIYSKLKWWLPAYEYKFVDTDYDHYSIVHSCTSYFCGTFNVQLSWIFSRHATVSESLMANLMDRINDQGIDTERYVYTEQNDCPADERRTKYKKKSKEGDKTKTDSNEIDVNDINSI